MGLWKWAKIVSCRFMKWCQGLRQLDLEQGSENIIGSQILLHWLVLNVRVEPFQDLFELAFLTECRGVKSSWGHSGCSTKMLLLPFSSLFFSSRNVMRNAFQSPSFKCLFYLLAIASSYISSNVFLFSFFGIFLTIKEGRCVCVSMKKRKGAERERERDGKCVCVWG